MNTAQASERIGNGMTKIERYGWVRGGPPGELMWVEKQRIQIPEEYQRDQARQEKKIQDIASEFDWTKFGVIVLARRNRDDFFVVDGLGRLSAALKRADVQKVPCIAFDLNSLSDEAKAFLGLNTYRKAVTAVDKFKPQLIAGSAEAALVEDLCASSGRRVAGYSGPDTVFCVAALMKMARVDPERLRRVWPLVCDVCAGKGIHERILQSLMYIDKHMSGPEQITAGRWRRRLLQVGYQELVAATHRAAAFYARGGANVWSKGIVEAINKGLRDHNRITLTAPDVRSRERRDSDETEQE